MKNYLLFFLLVLHFFSGAQENILHHVKQKIQYHAPNAGEVYIVWGINGWYEPESEMLPADTYIKDGLAYTRMQRNHDVFSCDLLLRQNLLLDYVFLISEDEDGKSVELWDNNTPPFKDYHALLYNHCTTRIEADENVLPKTAKNILIASETIFLFAGGIFVLAFLLRKRKLIRATLSPAKLIAVTSITLFVFILFIRPSVAGFFSDIIRPLDFSFNAFPAAYYDFWFVAVLTSLFLIPVLILKKYSRFTFSLAVVYVFFSLVTIIAEVLNIRVVEMLGKPFNYQWLYYSDFLKSADSRVALNQNISSEYISKLVFLSISFVLLSISFFLLMPNIALALRQKRIAFASLFFALSFYIATAKPYIESKKWEYDQLANPLAEFLFSINPLAAQPSLFTMQVPDSLRYCLPNKNYSNKFSKDIKNVLIYVLESVPAEYIGVYGKNESVTPVLDQYSKMGVTFGNIYAHAPATNLSMVSMLCSVYPRISYNSLTEEHPDMPLPSLISVLKESGFECAFFNSADNNFQNAGRFFKARGFDHISDCNSLGKKEFYADDGHWKHMGGQPDSITANEMLDWIEKKKEKKWISMMWSYQTHYPYFFKGTEVQYSSNKDLNRYLNALNNADKVLGHIIESLKTNKLFDSTLIVIIGDHGEAFGRHDQITHGRKIYEENLHVPCFFINDALEKKWINEPGGIIDVAPSVLNVLGIECPFSWQGSSLFNRNRYQPVYFFAPWSDYLFGFRQGDLKFIYNASKGKTELYNIRDDPEEANNLSGKIRMSYAHERLAGWTQYANHFIDSILSAHSKHNNF
jgi:lipoteichoic acid synthase